MRGGKFGRTWKLDINKRLDRLITNIQVIDDEKSCWNWIGPSKRNKGGYGAYKWSGQTWLSHRLIWHLFIEPLTDPEIKCCHKCDNRLCARPSHLFIGTQNDNIQDMKQKGRARSPKGSASKMSKLTEGDIPEIKKLRKQGMTQEAIGNKYEVCHSAIGSILRGKTWTHV